MKRLTFLTAMLLAWTLAWAQVSETRSFQVVLDTNGDTDNGCAFVLENGQTVVGGELLGTVSVTLGADPEVTSVTWLRCNGQTETFSQGVFSDGGWPVGSDVGISASDVIEFGLPSDFLGVTQQIQVLGQASGADSYDIVPDNGAFLPFGLPVFVPTLGTWALILFVVALLGFAIWRGRQGRLSQAGTAMSVLLVAVLFLAPVVTIRLDGDVDDWSGIDPLAFDPAGDTTNTRGVGGGNDPTTDILAFYAAQGAGDVYFRFDVAELENRAPVVGDDSATTDEDMAVTFDVLGNDSDPDGDTLTVASAGTPGNGSVVIEADDQLTYTPDADFNGVDSFTYTVADALGITASGTVTVTVNPVNDDPVALNGNAATGEDEPVVITLTGSDVDGDTLTFAIVTTPSSGTLSAITPVTATTAQVTYTPTTNVKGSDSFTFTVNDGTVTSLAASIDIAIAAEGDAPTANDDSATTDEDMAVIIDALANDTDPDTGDAIEILSTTQPSNGSVSIQPDGTLEFTPSPNYNGNDSFSYTIRDLSGLSDSATVNITVNAVNDPPVALNDAAVANDTDPLNFGVLSNDSDIDGDSLTVTAITTPPAEGNLVIEVDNTLTYTPDGGHSGSDSFVYEIQDPDGAAATATVSMAVVITGGDTTPLIGDDEVSTPANVAVTFDVLANDNALGQGPLFIFGFSQASNGSVALLTDDLIEYTPNPGFVGVDTFTYTVSNQLDETATGNITVTVTTNPTAPIAIDDMAQTEVGSSVTVAVLGNDTDANVGATLTVVDTGDGINGTTSINGGTTVTYTPNPGFEGQDAFAYTIEDETGLSDSAVVTVDVLPAGDISVTVDDFFELDEDGTLTFDPTANDLPGVTLVGITQGSLGGVVNNGNGTLTYTVNADVSGDDSFTYEVSEPVRGGATVTGNVNIRIRPQAEPPRANRDDVSTDEDTPINIAVLDNDTDPDGGSLTVVRVTRTPRGTTVIEGDGSITFAPEADFNGTARFVYTIENSDGFFNSALVVVTVNAVNDAPVANDDISSTAEDMAVVIDVLANDTDSENDIDATTVVVVTGPSNGGTTVNPTTGEVTYTPDLDYVGVDSFTYTVADAGDPTGTIETSNEATVNIEVGGVPDTVADSDSTLEETPVDIDVLANDGGPGDVLDPATVTVASGPANGGASVNPADGVITYTPDPDFFGSDSFTYTVEDVNGTGSMATAVDVTVTGVNDAPTFTAGADQTVLEDAGAQTVTSWATAIDAGANEGAQSVSFTIVSNTNAALFSAGPAIDAAGNLTYTPADDANGSADITIELSDDGGTADGGVDTSAQATFTINVTAVNDAPSFVSGGDRTVSEDVGAQAVNGWATAITPGPADESGQMLTFNVTGNTNAALFDVAPSVDPTSGDLTFTVAAATSGTATITLELSDDGGTANGGADTSAAVTFDINVDSVNDEPTFTVGADQTVLEDAGAQTVNGWATAIDPGAGESGQVLTFNIVSNTNAALFSAGPAIDGTTGDLTFTPAADANGSATITIELQDDGGTANGGDDTSPQASFDIDVTAVNDAPSFTVGADQTVLEEAGAQTVNGWATAISAGPTDESGQVLTFNITNNTNAALFAAGPAVDTAGNLTYTPAADASGTATITLELADDGGTADGGADTSPTATFDINITAINDAPSFTVGADQTVLEDAGAQTVNGWATSIDAGTGESGQVLTFNITGNTNAALFAAGPAIDAAGNLTYTPTADANGSATITIELQDDGGTANGGVDTSASANFDINVTAVNDAPSFTTGADQTVLEDAGAQTVNGWATSVSAGPADESGQVLTFNITGNTNAALFAAGPAVDASGNLTYTPAADANGTATITLTLSDDGGTADGGADTSAGSTFDINITAVNDQPSFTAGADQNYTGSATQQTVVGWATAIDPGAANESGQVLTFNITGNTNAALFDVAPAVDGTTGNLTYTPANGASGTTTISLTLSDDGGTANGGVDTSAGASFDITITALNSEPTFTAGGNETILEDAGAQTVNGWATAIDDGDGGSQVLTFTVNNDNNALFTVQPDVDETTGNLTYTPAADAFGVANVSVVLSDDGGTAGGGDDTSPTANFTITITGINDVPSFTAGADETVNEDAGAQTVNGWATGLSTGPANESGQTLSFNVSNDNNGLFSAQPAIDASGNLTYTPAANAFGSATVTVSISDDGGTANGGVDTSATQNFTITVTAVNDPPVAGADSTFSTIGNVTLVVDLAAPSHPHIPITTTGGTGLLENDSDPVEGDSISITEINGVGANVGMAVATTGSGSVTVNANGTLSYTPPPGVSGTTDTFTYTITDSPGAGTPMSDTATVTITIGSDLVWFLDNSAAAGGNGTSATPFDEVSDYETARGGGTVVAGDILFVHRGNSGSTAYDGTITLLDNMSLFGELFGLSITNPNTASPLQLVAAGTAPVLSVTAGGSDAIVAANSVSIRGVDIDGTTDDGIQLNNVTGVSVTDVSVNNIGQHGIEVSGASAGLTLSNFDVVGTTADGINIDGMTDGLTFQISGTGSSASALNGAGDDAISISNLTSNSGTNSITITNSGGGAVTVDSATTSALRLDNIGGTTTTAVTGMTVTNSPAGVIATTAANADLTYAFSSSNFTTTTGTIVDIRNTEATSTVELSMTGQQLASTSGDALVVQGNAGSQLAVTALGITGNVLTGGAGFAFTNCLFDADTATGGTQQVAVAGLTLGTSASPLGGNALSMTSCTGDLSLGSVNLDTTSGAAFTATTSGTFSVASTGGTLVADAGAGVNLNGVASGLIFSSLTSTNSSTDGITVAGISGTFEVTGATTINHAGAADGIDITGSGSATFTFDDLSVTTANGTGLRFDNNAVAAGTLNVSATTSAAISATGGPAFLLNNVGGTSTFNIATSNGSGSTGISLTSTTGTLTINGGSITTSTGTAFALSGGTAVTTFDGSITNTSGRLVTIESMTGGSIDLGGALTDAGGLGILVQNNSSGGPVVDFDGTVDISNSTGTAVTSQTNTGATVNFANLDITNTTSNQDGLFVSNSGTFSSTTGIINTGSGRGVDIDNTILGVTLASVSSSSGNNPGIDLNTTTGSFTVNGDGSNTTQGGNGTGGTIANKGGGNSTTAGIGVLLNNVTNVVLRRMQLNDHVNWAIYGNNVNGLVLEYLTIDGTNGDDAGPDEGSIYIDNLTGTALAGSNPTSFVSIDIEGGLEDNIRLNNSSGTLADFRMTNSRIGLNSNALGNDGMLLNVTSSANVTATVSNNTFVGARGDMFQAAAGNSSVLNVTFSSNTCENTHGNIVSGGGGLTFNSGGAGSSETYTYSITGNTIRDAVGSGITVNKGTGSGTMSGTLSGNTIGESGVTTRGSTQASGINLVSNGAGSHTANVLNNFIYGYNEDGITVEARDGSTKLETVIQGNTIANPGGFAIHGIYVNCAPSVTDTTEICLTLGGAGGGQANSFVGSNGGFDEDFRIRQRNSGTVNVIGYGGGNTDDAAVIAFIQSINTGSPTGRVDINTAIGNTCSP